MSKKYENMDKEKGQEESNYDYSQSSHPIALLFTLIFKAAAVVSYFFLGLFLDSTLNFIIITLLNCFDFWAVKNITGRLLVGMRWQTKFDQEGEEYWEYESFDHQHIPNTVDKSFFWTSQILVTGFWGVFTILKILSLSVYNICLAGLGFILAACNLYGFYRCSKEHQKKMQDLKKNVAKEGLKYMVNQQFK